MAWRSSGRTNVELVANLARNGIVRTEAVRAAMLAVDRADFVPPDQRGAAYNDTPLPIGANATISAPHMHAHALEELAPTLLGRPGATLLDVGSGSGILLAYGAALVAGAGGRVYGVEHVPELVAAAAGNLAKSAATAQLVADRVIVNAVGDGFRGDPQHAPFDAIHVGAAAASVPQALLAQLAPGGRLLIPVGGSGAQQLMAFDKAAGGGSGVKATALLGVTCVAV
jgi:protein-L-isoaspartate(D-aspartate) O-methyltransferase